MPRPLPSRASLDQLKHQAKDLLKAQRAGDPDAMRRVREAHPRFSGRDDAAAPRLTLAGAQLVVAREYGFASWAKLKARVEAQAPEDGDPVAAIKAAIHADDAGRVRRLFDRHPALRARVNEPIGPFNSPALHSARSRAMLDALVDAGADLNATSRWWAGGFRFLHTADPELAAYAIQRGASVDVHAASRLRLFDRLRALVEADPALVRARGGDGQTPLHVAGTVEIAAYLLDRGAEIDALDVDHESTPAQYMLDHRPDVARHLVERGCRTDLLLVAALGDADRVRAHLDADPSCLRLRVNDAWFPMADPRAGGHIYRWTLGDNATAYHAAAKFGHDHVVRLLMERSPAEARLVASCWLGDGDAVRALLADDPSLAARLPDSDRSEVARAARNNETEPLRLLLEAGLPAVARGQHGGTPLHWAAWHGNLAMVRALLRHGPPLEDAENDFRATPLGWATHGSEHGWHCRTGDYPGVVAALLEAGAKPLATPQGTEAVQDVQRLFSASGKPTETGRIKKRKMLDD